MSPLDVTWEAAHVRRLGRHGLAPDGAHPTPAAAASAMAGAQAQVQASAEHSVARRVTGATRTDVQRALWEERSLIRVHGPRGTVHLLPTEDLPGWTGALGAVPWRSPFAEDVRLSPAQTDEVVAAVGEALEDDDLTIDELTDAVVRRVGPWAGERVMPAFQDFWPRWRQALDTAGHRGALCFGRPRGRRVTYAHPRRWLPGFRPAPADEAVGAVLRHYLRAYGPATSQQFAQWIGAPPRWAADRFAEHASELTAVTYDGSPAWVAADDTTFADGPVPPIVLLPYFDAFVIGCRPRERLFPGPAATRALAPSGQAGNFPVLLVDGVAAGVWHQRRSGRRVAVTVEPLRRLSRAHLTALDAEVARVGAILEGDPTLTVGPVTVGGHA